MSKGGMRALVSDQELAMRRYLRLSLAAKGYTVYEARSGEQALSIANTRRPDVVILDLDFPDLGGIEIMRLLRQWIQVPILVIAGRNVEALKIAALDGYSNCAAISLSGWATLRNKRERLLDLGECLLERQNTDA